MASTNKTTNYELSQYVGTDKPTYLGDYNGDMLKIDTQMKANADAISTANTTATAANTTANTANTNASSALSAATTAGTAASAANSTANSALAKATANELAIAKFNLTNFTSITTFTKTGGGTLGTSQINVATNSDGSLAKIYGTINISNVTNGGSNPGKVSFSTSLRPTENITINGGCIVRAYNNTNKVSNIYLTDYTIKTNGDVEVNYNYNDSSGEPWRGMFINSLIFVKDFGDTPVTPE